MIRIALAALVVVAAVYGSIHATQNTANGRSLGSQTSTAELSDLWLCLACALGWTLWLISSHKQTQPEPMVYDQEESIQVTGNVLEVTVGEDADGTGIPVYLALIDYVVEYHDPDIDTVKFRPEKVEHSSASSFSQGVVLQPDTNAKNKENHVQVRKCFYTNRLLQEGFANVKVICLYSDPTTSMLYDDYLEERRQHKKPDDALVLYMVYAIATTLIVTSIYGGYNTIFRLPKDEQDVAYVILVVGTIFLFPLATLLYHSFTFAYRRFSERKGTIIYGSEKFQCTRMACGVHTIMEEETEQEASSLQGTSSVTPRRGNSDNMRGLEMPTLDSSGPSEYQPPPAPRQYPNAGCALNEYNVQTLQHNTSIVSSISSTGSTKSNTSETQVNSCLTGDATAHLMEAFQNMSALTVPAATVEISESPKKQDEEERLPKIAVSKELDGDTSDAETSDGAKKIYMA
eukprot:scaffold1051_cov119-Cylindrotheca_fusiformis.AAC.21